jgi:hypothetical protein
MAKNVPAQDSSKRKRAGKEEMQARLEEVFVLIRQGYPNSRIKKMLMDRGLHEKAANRAIKTTWDMIAGLGSQATSEQRGLVLSRINHLYCEVSAGEGKNIDQAIKLLDLQTKLIPTLTKGETLHDNPKEPNPSGNPVSSQLIEILQRLGGVESAEGSDDGSHDT